MAILDTYMCCLSLTLCIERMDNRFGWGREYDERSSLKSHSSPNSNEVVFPVNQYISFHAETSLNSCVWFFSPIWFEVWVLST